MTAAQVAGLDDPELLAQCEVEGRQPGGVRRIGLGLSGMYCAACAITIEDALMGVPGVREVRVQAATQRARILFDPRKATLSTLVRAVQRVGYRAWPDAAARAGNERLKDRRKLLWRLAVAGFCMMQVMMITTMQYVAGPGEIPPDLWNLMNWACWVLSLPVLFFSCGPFLVGAWRAARQGRVAMDTPVALGIVAMFVVSMGASFGATDIFGHDAYFDSLTMFVTFLLGGRWLESRAREGVTQSLEALCTRLPESVERAVAGTEADALAAAQVESIPISSLQHGDLVRVAVGQAFPADGQILLGRTEVDEALLTGESRAVPRQQGQMVVAGSVNLGASVWIAVERLGPDTRYQQIVSLVHQALTEKPGWMRAADRFAGPFLWTVLALAALGALAWLWIDPARSIWVAVSVLVVTCPCALSLAAPSALLAAAGSMARHGVLVRHLDALEALSSVQQFYFDKTGTLTEGELHLIGVIEGVNNLTHSVEQGARVHSWHAAVSLAMHSQHPLSRSLVQAAQRHAEDGQVPAFAWHDVREEAGKGVVGIDVAGRRWKLGAASWVLGESSAAQAAQLPNAALARVWFGPVDDEQSLENVLGFVFDESLRADAAPALAGLHELGVRSAILSGDRQDRVDAAVTLLGGASVVDVAAAEATPETKLRVIAEMHKHGHRVAVVGDGINDAPVLAKADVSIALDQGSALAQSQADLLILGGRLKGIPLAVQVSRRASAVVRQNLVWAAAYNLICIPVALVGWLPPWLAGLGMALSSLGVVLNALRLSKVSPAN
ncbi:heavy metal translocating P-type ATPase [Aquabacterium sp.]|uniref:heavy metal translocating P-type ATPase n=1 Tax=Aquabacterium sp. TaxID=1872578 RepID=UPI0035B22A3D